jgi:hypothetical protein
MESSTCPAWNAIFFYNAKKLVTAIVNGPGSDSTTDKFTSTWNQYNNWLEGNIETTPNVPNHPIGSWIGPTYPTKQACDSPVPLAGAVRSLISKAAGL